MISREVRRKATQKYEHAATRLNNNATGNEMPRGELKGDHVLELLRLRGNADIRARSLKFGQINTLVCRP